MKKYGGFGSQKFPLYVLFRKYLPHLVKSLADFLQIFLIFFIGEILHVTVIRIHYRISPPPPHPSLTLLLCDHCQSL